MADSAPDPHAEALSVRRNIQCFVTKLLEDQERRKLRVIVYAFNSST